MHTAPARDPRRDVAKGVGSAFLAKFGAVIDIVVQPAYTWMFGLATYGLYSVLWSSVNVIEKVANLAMTNALQRVLPKAIEPGEKAGIIKGALVLGILPGVVLAAILSLAAPFIASIFNVAEGDRQQLVIAIALFVWAIPLWAALEVSTSALRACRAFGPDIRLRLVWEQLLRLLLAVVFWLFGMSTLALLLAHMISMAVTTVLALRLLGRYCNLRLIWQTPLSLPVLRELFISGVSVIPANLSGRLFSDMPVIIINLFLPGAKGANAAGLYSIARKLSSIPHLIGNVFTHVLAPIAASRENREHDRIQSLYAFAVRLSIVLALPTAVTLITLTDSILKLYVPEAAAAWSIVLILTLARGLEASGGSAVVIQQVISHRGLPLLNNFIGLSIAGAVMLYAVPRLDTIGVALGVAVGQMILVALSIYQLYRMEQLKPYDRNIYWPLGAMLIACLVILLGGRLLVVLPVPVQVVLIFLLYLVSLWLSLRFALPSQDHLNLGKFGRTLRLT